MVSYQDFNKHNILTFQEFNFKMTSNFGHEEKKGEMTPYFFPVIFGGFHTC